MLGPISQCRSPVEERGYRKVPDDRIFYLTEEPYVPAARTIAMVLPVPSHSEDNFSTKPCQSLARSVDPTGLFAYALHTLRHGRSLGVSNSWAVGTLVRAQTPSPPYQNGKGLNMTVSPSQAFAKTPENIHYVINSIALSHSSIRYVLISAFQRYLPYEQ